MQRPYVRLAMAMVALAVTGCRAPQRDVEPSTGMVFVRIPAGSFRMGSPEGEAGRQRDETLHRVILSRPFYLSESEVTQGQWSAVMGFNPSHFHDGGSSAPVENVTWFEVQEFLKRLNERGEGRFRLPTEAEWEYACRAGSESAYAFGDRLSAGQANYDGRYPLPGQKSGEFRGKTLPVKSFPPNRWGLYDMHGNVWEWCADEYCPYPPETVRDPLNHCHGRYKVIRGGSWYFGADSARSALRYTHEPQLRGFSLGFRVVRESR